MKKNVTICLLMSLILCNNQLNSISMCNRSKLKVLIGSLTPAAVGCGLAELFIKYGSEAPVSLSKNVIVCTLAALIPMGIGFLISYSRLPEGKYRKTQKYIENLQKSKDWNEIFAAFEDKDTFLRKIKNYYKSELVPIISAYDFLHCAYRKLKNDKKVLEDILQKKGNYIHWISELELLISTIDELMRKIEEVETVIEQEPDFDKWLIIKRLSDEIIRLRHEEVLRRQIMLQVQHQQMMNTNQIIQRQQMMNMMQYRPIHMNPVHIF